MRPFWNWFMYSLLLSVGDVSVVWTEETSKYVCNGVSIQLFKNITIDNLQVVVQLYKNDSKKHLIAMWTLSKATITDGYSTKVFLDEYGDVWLRNVCPSDEAQYALTRIIGDRFITSVVYLTVLVAPARNCKPKIISNGDVLSASLETNICGRPTVSLHWLDYSRLQYEGKDVVKLPQHDNVGTYYACIDGPALRCAMNSTLSDYCSSHTIGDMSGEQCTECKSSTSCVVLHFLVVVLSLGLVVSNLNKCMIFRRRRRKLKTKDVEERGGTTSPTDIDLQAETKDVGSGELTSFLKASNSEIKEARNNKARRNGSKMNSKTCGEDNVQQVLRYRSSRYKSPKTPRPELSEDVHYSNSLP